MNDPIGASAREIANAVRSQDISAQAVLDAHLDQIEANEELNAFITVLEDSAREQARRADEAASAGEDLGPLHGVPVAIKDLMQRKAGVRNTMGVAALAENVAKTDSITVERLEAAGAVLLGTTNTPELGHTIKTDNEFIGATPTPLDPDRTRSAGGSSGGSAAALAAGMATITTGSDIGGSLRIPAACCGVASLKPTFGRVPLDNGLDRFSAHSPFLVVGPLARTVDDLALGYELLAGVDDRDPFSVPDTREVDLNPNPAAYSIAYSPDLDLQPVDPQVRETVGSAVADLENAGATVDDVDPDLPDQGAFSAAYIQQTGVYFATVAAQIEERFDIDFQTATVAETVRSTIALADGVTATADRMHNVVRSAAYDGIEAVLDSYDVLITPTLTVPPYGKHLADGYPTEIDGESVMGVPTDAMLTWVFNATGHPVAAVPAGETADGLPVGLQVVGKRYDEETVLSVAAALEAVRPWQAAYPFRR